MNFKFGFVGVGVMSGAILSRMLEKPEILGIKPSDIIIYDTNPEQLNKFARLGAVASNSNQSVFENAELVVLGIKPQLYASILNEIQAYNCKTVISIMAGVKINSIKNQIKNDMIGVARVMPNTPCQIGKGVSAICFNGVDEAHKNLILTLFSLCGRAITVPESKFDAVTSISGSGTAYVYTFINSLVKAGIEGGLTHEESKILTIETFKGAAELAGSSNCELEALVESVCSKGGTTIEAIASFKSDDIEGIIKKGIRKCRQKSELLSSKF